MILQNMDETLDDKTTLRLNEEQLRLAKVNEINVGTEFTLTCKAVCIEIHEGNSENGMPESSAILDLSRIVLEGDTPPKTPAGRLYNRSNMVD